MVQIIVRKRARRLNVDKMRAQLDRVTYVAPEPPEPPPCLVDIPMPRRIVVNTSRNLLRQLGEIPALLAESLSNPARR